MADFKQAFGTRTSLTVTGLSSLAAGSTAISNEVDNSTNLYDEVIIEILVGYNAADSASAWADVRIHGSTDGGVTYWTTWETPYLVLPAIDMSKAGTTGAPTYTVYQARFVPPQRWKVEIKNNHASQALNQGTVYWQGVYYTG